MSVREHVQRFLDEVEAAGVARVEPDVDGGLVDLWWRSDDGERRALVVLDDRGVASFYTRRGTHTERGGRGTWTQALSAVVAVMG